MERVLAEGVNDTLASDAFDKRSGLGCDKVGGRYINSIPVAL